MGDLSVASARAIGVLAAVLSQVSGVEQHAWPRSRLQAGRSSSKGASGTPVWLR